jgi:signal transduction histidine kinase
VADVASQSVSLNPVLERAIEKITEIFDFEITRIHLRNEQTDEIVRRAAFEKHPEQFPGTRSFKPGQGIIGHVVATGRSLIFSDVEADPRYAELSRTKIATRSRNRFFAVFPIRSKLRVIGTLSCLGSAPRKLTPSEIQLLEALTDQLAVAIENTRLYEAVSLKVDELQRKTIELEQANKIKDEFLSVVSHELRTPINVLMGYTALFKDGVFGDLKPAQEAALAKIAREAKDLLAMINTLLYATALETDPSGLEKQEISPSELLAELRANYAVTVPSQVRMRWQYPADLPLLHTDRRKLRQVLDNLIGNAVKFTDAGEVTVAAEIPERPSTEMMASSDSHLRDAGSSAVQRIEFKVRDTGVGIPADRLSKIFEKFYQVDSTETRRYGGVGMGLYIAKKFAESLGGNIAVESTEGKGSTFTLTVPCTRILKSTQPAETKNSTP